MYMLRRVCVLILQAGFFFLLQSSQFRRNAFGTIDVVAFHDRAL